MSIVEKRTAPRVFTIPSGAQFLDTLADALLTQRLVNFPTGDPLALADVAILLPTRRAARAFREALVRRLGADAAILPAIRTIADVDEEEHLLAPASEPVADRLTLPAAVTSLQRRLTLTRLTLAWGRHVREAGLARSPGEPLLVPASAADATRLAGDLARLLDDMETAGVPWARLDTLVPDDHADYFRLTLEFLKIVAEQWPAYLGEIGRVDPAVRRDILIRAYADRVKGPIVAAGSTGSVPATAHLLGTIARLPNGAVVLPGLDQGLDEAGWSAIGSDDAPAAANGHPQFGLKQLLGRLHIDRRDVEPLGTPSADVAARTRLLAEATRPADTTDAWTAPSATALLAGAGAALAGAGLLVARNEQEEATAIALVIREAVETPKASVALVTPDRTIARRVAVELARWGLDVDDSAGLPLEQAGPGVFARLVAEAALSDADPAALLALLKHPLAAFRMERGACRHAARMLELAVFRGDRVSGGIAGLSAALAARKAEREVEGAHISFARRRMSPRDWRAAERIAGQLATVLGPLERGLAAEAGLSVPAATALLAAAVTEAATDNKGADGIESAGPAGTKLLGLFASLTEEGSGADGLMLDGAEYPFFLAALMGDVSVPRPPRGDPRVHIWGTLEARLQSVDLLILGGLDEGAWPAVTRTDPFLSRAMRAEIGLPAPERRIGLAAHDFVEGMCAPRVIVTRSEKRAGTPTVESRWLQRLRALAGEEAAAAMVQRGSRYIAMARGLDHVPQAEVRAVRRPQPRPPVAVRPRRLSITEIETLIRDPYAVYAKHILHLRPLDEIGVAPDGRLRGTLMHEALNRFTGEWHGPFDAAAEARLRQIGDEALESIAEFGDVHAVWSIRFAAIARWIVAWEAARDAAVAARHTEVAGKLDIAAPGGPFVLTGRADRIDRMADGTLAIYDFKTGTPQSERTVFAGLTPQMTLEAATARAGGFENIPAAGVSDLAWLSLGKAGRDEPYKSAVLRNQTADDLADRAHAMLTELVAAFDDEQTPYLSRARPLMERYLGDYEHLARVREWALVDSAEDIVMSGGPAP